MRNPDAARNYQLKYRFGITADQYDELLEQQQGKCALCGTECQTGRRLAVDHDHTCCPNRRGGCGRCVRGLLCVKCNTWLGAYEQGDPPMTVEQYLSKPYVEFDDMPKAA